MPITLFFARLLGVLIIVLLAATALRAPDAAGWVSAALVWVALVGVPVFIAEALGLLTRAAGFFFGRRRG